MPLFQFTPYDGRGSLGAILQLMQEPARAEAEAARVSADARGRAAEVSGRAWAGAAGSLADVISGVAKERAAAPERAQAQRLREAQIEGAGLQNEVARNTLDEQARGRTYRDALAGAIKAVPRLEESGASLFDVDGIARALAEQGLGDHVAETAQHLEAVNNVFREGAVLRTRQVGVLADKVRASGYDPELATYLVNAAADNGLVPRELAQSYAEKMLDGGPEMVKRIVDAVSGPERSVTLKEGDQVRGAITGAVQMDGPEKTQIVPPGASVVQGGQVQFTAPPRAPTAQPADFELAGVGRVKGSFVPGADGQPGRYFYAGQDVTEKARGLTPASVIVQNQAAGQQLPEWAFTASRPLKSDANANTQDSVTGFTPNGLYQAAVNYIQTGQVPPSGRGSDPRARAMRDAISGKVGAIAAAAGMDLPTMRMLFKVNAGSLAQTQKMADAVEAFMAKADKDVDNLSKLLPKIGDTGSPFFNKPLREFQGQVLGNKDQAAFLTYLTSVQNEYGRIISQPNLAGQMTDSARHEAQQLVDPNATVGQMLASIEALKAEGENRLVTLGEQLQKIQARTTVSPAGAEGVGGATGATGTPGSTSAGVIYARDTNGQVHQAPAGTPLPSGWVQVERR